MEYKKIIYSGHSLTRMFQRCIDPEIVELSLISGKIIENYPEDTPYPSFLVLHFINDKPIHIVASIDISDQTIFIITAYYPDVKIWENDFENRRRKS